VVREHVRGEAGFSICDVLAQGSDEMRLGTNCRIVRKGGDLVQQEVPDSCAGRAGEDGLLEGLWSSLASSAGWVLVLVEPRGMGGQITFC